MAYSELLADLILPCTNGWKIVELKKMFGGVGYKANGNMCFGIYKDFLILRIGEDTVSELLKEDHIKVFDITGRPMKGWVMIEEQAYCKPENIQRYISLAKSFVDALPPK